jgi:hypothetical protein
MDDEFLHMGGGTQLVNSIGSEESSEFEILIGDDDNADNWSMDQNVDPRDDHLFLD